MPTYEVVLLLQTLAREPLKDALRRSATYVFDFGGTLRKLENLGERPLPYYIRTKGRKHVAANFFVMNLDVGVPEMGKIVEKLRLDLDVVRASYWMRSQSVLQLHNKRKPPECTMEEDLLPPPYRKNVIELQKLAQKKSAPKHTHKNYDDTDFLIY